MNTQFENEIVAEKMIGMPELLEGEVIEYDAKHGMQPFLVALSVVGTFIPPFFWGPALFVMIWLALKNRGIWITNKRFINFQKAFPLTQKYGVISIPFSKIRSVEFASAKDAGSFSEFFEKVSGKVFGISDITVFLNDSKRDKYSFVDIKNASRLLDEIRKRCRN